MVRQLVTSTSTRLRSLALDCEPYGPIHDRDLRTYMSAGTWTSLEHLTIGTYDCLSKHLVPQLKNLRSITIVHEPDVPSEIAQSGLPMITAQHLPALTSVNCDMSCLPLFFHDQRHSAGCDRRIVSVRMFTGCTTWSDVVAAFSASLLGNSASTHVIDIEIQTWHIEIQPVEMADLLGQMGNLEVVAIVGPEYIFESEIPQVS